MDNLNNIPNVGNWGDAASKLNDNFNKVKQAVTTVENTTKNNKGYFTSLSALNTAFPSPKAGQTAYVYNEASSTKYYIYNAVNGAWVASSIGAPSVGVDIAGYTKTGGSTKTTKQVEEEIVQLAGDMSEYVDVVETIQHNTLRSLPDLSDINTWELNTGTYSPNSNTGDWYIDKQVNAPHRIRTKDIIFIPKGIGLELRFNDAVYNAVYKIYSAKIDKLATTDGWISESPITFNYEEDKYIGIAFGRKQGGHIDPEHVIQSTTLSYSKKTAERHFSSFASKNDVEDAINNQLGLFQLLPNNDFRYGKERWITRRLDSFEIKTEGEEKYAHVTQSTDNSFLFSDKKIPLKKGDIIYASGWIRSDNFRTVTRVDGHGFALTKDITTIYPPMVSNVYDKNNPNEWQFLSGKKEIEEDGDYYMGVRMENATPSPDGNYTDVKDVIYIIANEFTHENHSLEFIRDYLDTLSDDWYQGLESPSIKEYVDDSVSILQSNLKNDIYTGLPYIPNLRNEDIWEKNTGAYTVNPVGNWYLDVEANAPHRVRTKDTFKLLKGESVHVHFDDTKYKTYHKIYRQETDPEFIETSYADTEKSPMLIKADYDCLVGILFRSISGDIDFEHFIQNVWITPALSTDNINIVDEINDYLLPLFRNQGVQLGKKLMNIENNIDFKFAFITDTHYIDYGYPSLESKNYLHARNVAELSRQQDLDLVVHGGDISFDYQPLDHLIRCMQQVTSELRKSNCPVMITQGNHDTGDYYYFQRNLRQPENMISPSQWGKLISTDNDGRVYGDFSRSYYYKDFDESKIRVIVLNTHDSWVLDEDGLVKYNRGQHIAEYPYTSALKEEQLKWFAEDALNFDGKDGFGVIVISHETLLTEIAHPDFNLINRNVANSILVARKNKTSYSSEVTSGDFAQDISVDYTEANDIDVICVINGHRHLDIHSLSNGINYVSVICTRYQIGMTMYSDNDAWDMFNVDRESRKVIIKRFGNRGVDREFYY